MTNPLIGKTVRAVFLATDGSAIRFDLDGGESVFVPVYGDCCSQSWIEEVQGVEQLVGSPVVAVEDVQEMPCKAGNRYGHDEEVMEYYGCKITTGKGYALIDYRNSSNGYYGGSLSWGYAPRGIENEEWRQLVGDVSEVD